MESGMERDRRADNDSSLRGEGYPLREEALVESPSAPTVLESERLAEPVVLRRRRPNVSASPWPILLLVLTVAGVGAAYVLTHRETSPKAHAAPALSPTPAAAPPPPARPANAPPTTPNPAKTRVSSKPVPAQSVTPRVTGFQVAEAVSMLRREGLTAVLRKVASDLPTGRVLGQNPSAGTRQAKGGRVTLSVSLQPMVLVPNVVGMQGLTANHALTAEHLVVSLAYVPSSQPARTVVAQYPRAQTRVKRGTHIQINISKGGLNPSWTNSPHGGIRLIEPMLACLAPAYQCRSATLTGSFICLRLDVVNPPRECLRL